MLRALPPVHLATATFVVATALAGIIVAGVLAAFGKALEMPMLAALDQATQEALLTFVLFGLLIVVAVVGMRLSSGEWPRLAAPDALLAAGTGLALGVVGVALCTALAALAGPLGTAPVLRSIGLLLVGTIVVFVQAGAEEVYFRGWVQPTLQQGWGRWAGIAATAVAFAVLHMASGAIGGVTILNLLLGGVWFGLLADRSGGIVLPALAHFGWNWTEALGLGLLPNPGVGSFGAIADIEIVGSPFWGGGAEGLNASIAMTFVLVALLAITATFERPFTAQRG